MNSKKAISPLTILIIFLVIMIFSGNWLFSYLFMSDEQKYSCYLKLPTNETFDSVKIRIFEKDNLCCFEEREYFYSEGFREQGTFSYFIFGSGKGTHTRYVDKCEALE